MRRFTIIEILVMIAIVGTVATVAISAISNSRMTPRENCEKQALYKRINDLPAACIQYYK